MKLVKIYFFVVTLLLLACSTSGAHPYYVSICQLAYNRETHALEITLKTFADDLLLGLENAGHNAIFLGEDREHPKTDQFIFDYVKSKLTFEINGNSVNYNFIGKEMEDGVVWSYYEIYNVNELHSVHVNCTMLTEVLETQTNIIQIEKDKKIKNLLLNRRKSSGEIKFED